MKLYVVCIHQNRLIEAILMSTLNIPLLCRRSKKLPLIIAKYVLELYHDQPSLTRTIHISNKFPWSQRCSSHWSSHVIVRFLLSDATFEVRRLFGSKCFAVWGMDTLLGEAYSDNLFLCVCVPSEVKMGLLLREIISSKGANSFF